MGFRLQVVCGWREQGWLDNRSAFSKPVIRPGPIRGRVSYQELGARLSFLPGLSMSTPDNLMQIVRSIMNTTPAEGAGHTLLVAGQPENVGLPVTLPRESDGNMRRSGSDVVWLLQPSDKKQAVDERGRVHGAPELSPVKELLVDETFRVDSRLRSERRRCRRSRRKCTRLRGQDTRRGTAAARASAAQGFRTCRSDGRGAVKAAISRHPIKFDGTSAKAKAS